MGAHTTSDDPSRYRIAAEVEAWQAKDPIARLRLYLEHAGMADDAFFGSVEDEAAREAVTLRERVLSMPDPGPLEMFEHVYPGGSPELDEQRETFAKYLDSFAAQRPGRTGTNTGDH
jgi:pyruvate dehydrogenase E1 component alpha subunit